MITTSNRRITGLFAIGAALFALVIAGAGPARAADAPDTVKLSGWAWKFVLSGTTEGLPGATVKIDELPELETVTDSTGYWELVVPADATVTPYATAPGYYQIHDQTFHLKGRDLKQVNFQMPLQSIVEPFAAIAGAETEGVEGSKKLKQCGVVSTVYEREGRNFLTLDDFLGFAPHGVTGSTAQLTGENGNPSPKGPVYFNKDVIPTPSQTEASRDGGIVWPDVPTGTWTVSAQHPDSRFSTAQVTCEPGRLVNASPPWGVYEMYGTEEPNPAVLPNEVVADNRLDARVASAKVVRKGKARILKLKVSTSEKVTTRIVARQGARKAARKGTFARTRNINVRLGARFRGGSARVNVNLRDAAGNKAAFSTVVTVPGKGRRAVSIKDAKPTGGAPQARTVTISGNAYAFIFAGDMRRLDGAVIKVVEFPELETVAGEQGAWSLEVPDNAEVTPYATFPDTTPEDATDDYFTTYAQTFFTRGKNITRINFQMPKQSVVEALGAIVGAKMTGEAGQKVIEECAVVSTFFRLQRTKEGKLIDGRTYTNFDDFHDYRAHGVADATSTLTDGAGALGGNPVYFNSSVIPDPSQPVSSGDGGVVWPNIATGKYTVRGQHDTRRFAEAQITCAPGRLVNASPPWGLYEITGNEESNPATYAAPAPLVDRQVDSRLGSVRINNRRVIASVSTDSGEPVRVVINGRQGKRKFKANRNLASGRGMVRVKLPRRFVRGRVAASIQIRDGAGNRANTSAVLYNPR